MLQVDTSASRKEQLKKAARKWATKFKQEHGVSYSVFKRRRDPELYAKHLSYQRTRWAENEYIRARHRQKEKDVKRRLRREIVQHYGHRCICCGEKRYEFLTLDHVNNDGAEHRKQRHRGSTWLLYWAKKNNHPSTLQLLCWNCNLAKAIYGTCPHGEEHICSR